MRDASYPAATTTAHEGAVRGQQTTPANIFASILEALRRSRRLQAQGVFQQHGHLIAQPEEASLHNLIPDIGETRSGGYPQRSAAARGAPRWTSLDPDQRAVFNVWARSVVAFYSLLIISVLAAVLLGVHPSPGPKAVAAWAALDRTLADSSAPAPERIGK
jgi:hypothetical protein